MNETEVRKLFFVIQNTYSNFDDNDDKVLIWVDLLKDTPFELAQRNLRRYMLAAENKFPPHPGVLAETPTQRSEGPYVPNAAETRLLLAEMDVRARLTSPIPEKVREEMNALASRYRN